MSWLGRNVVWTDDDGKFYGGIVCMDNQSMNEVLITIFKPWRVEETVRGIKQDGPWDPMYRDCWLAEKNYDEIQHTAEA